METELLPCTSACGCKFHALSIYLHPSFTATQASTFPSITPGTQGLTLLLGRQRKKARLTNSQEATHEISLVRFSPHAP